MNDERKQFFIELEKKTGDAVEALEFVCINADKKTYAALSLASSRTELFGDSSSFARTDCIFTFPRPKILCRRYSAR